MALCTMGLGFSASDHEATFITFDAPGAVFGTSPASINPEGAISGIYFDGNFNGHGFLRARDGTITTFEAPDALPGGCCTAGTVPQSINPAGAIAGFYYDASGEQHGFVRAPDGAITTFDVPGSTGTGFPISINPAGEIAGNYSDANFVGHGFLRIPHGK
jgi:hypothetical protein